jgi:hypothetical protein
MRTLGDDLLSTGAVVLFLVQRVTLPSGLTPVRPAVRQELLDHLQLSSHLLLLAMVAQQT